MLADVERGGLDAPPPVRVLAVEAPQVDKRGQLRRIARSGKLQQAPRGYRQVAVPLLMALQALPGALSGPGRARGPASLQAARPRARRAPLEVQTKTSDVAVGDQADGEAEECFVNVVASFPADA
ncbi:hypothetical protein GCM10010308_63560 [Streptomyces vinaceusdrappus]|nr:hypothetical protein GCM10010301_63700 [Streptomyces plicatus]GHC36357.1 hypothetical protein GCM10010308_63560 [Streptomyces vinaceusdrappus]